MHECFATHTHTPACTPDYQTNAKRGECTAQQTDKKTNKSVIFWTFINKNNTLFHTMFHSQYTDRIQISITKCQVMMCRYLTAWL